MSTEHPAGTVAMVTALNRRTPYRAYFDGGTWREVGGGGFCVDIPETVRSLVVLDLADEDFLGGESDVIVRHLRNPLEHCAGKGRPCPYATAIADQIEAQTKPPKPDEPTGLGAVVEDADGGRYVRVTGDDEAPWASMPADESLIECLAWDEFTAVRTLSEGVPS